MEMLVGTLVFLVIAFVFKISPFLGILASAVALAIALNEKDDKDESSKA